MDKRTKIITFVSGGVALATLIAIIVKRNNNKRVVEEISRRIAGGVEETGTYLDLKDSPAFNPNFWKSFAGQKVVSVAYPDTVARELYTAINKINADEDKIFDIFNKLNSKFSISKVAYSYQTLFKKPLLEDLKTIDMSEYLGDDKKLFGISFGESDMQKIQKIVNSKPDVVKA